MGTSIIDVLKRDHRDVASLIAALRGSAPGELAKRKQILARIMSLLAMHMAFEERCVYPVLSARWLMRAESLEAVEEHDQIRSLLHDIARIKLTDERWMAAIDFLFAEISRHVQEEEQPGGLFDELGRVMTGDELDELTEAYAKSIRFEAAMRNEGNPALWRARMSTRYDAQRVAP